MDTRGIEPLTFHMRSENHTPRPRAHLYRNLSPPTDYSVYSLGGVYTTTNFLVYSSQPRYSLLLIDT